MRFREDGLCHYLHALPGMWPIALQNFSRCVQCVQGFGLTIGSDFYLLFNPEARHVQAATDRLEAHTYHGAIIGNNDSLPLAQLSGTFSFTDVGQTASHVIKGESLTTKSVYSRPNRPLQQDVIVTPSGPGGGSHSPGGRRFSWYRSTPSVRRWPTSRPCAASNCRLWSHSRVLLMQRTEGPTCSSPTDRTSCQRLVRSSSGYVATSTPVLSAEQRSRPWSPEFCSWSQ